MNNASHCGRSVTCAGFGCLHKHIGARLSLRLSLWLAAFFAILAPLPSVAQIPDVVAPDFLTTDNSANWEPGQLLYRMVGLDRTTNVVYHNGVLYAGGYATQDFDQWDWSDWTDAASLTYAGKNLVQAANQLATTQGTHGHSGKSGDWVLPGVKRTSTPGVNELINNGWPDWLDHWGAVQDVPPVAGAEGRSWQYYPWYIPFRWPQYGDSELDGHIYRHTTSLPVWPMGEEAGFVTGRNFLFGPPAPESPLGWG